MNNQAIQILRTKLPNTDTKVKDITLSEGQPFFNIATNKLYVGDGTKKISELKYVGEEVDDSLQSLISSEISRATGAESELNTRIDTETNRAKQEESKIDVKLDSEISRSSNFDNSHNNILNGGGSGSLIQVPLIPSSGGQILNEAQGKNCTALGGGSKADGLCNFVCGGGNSTDDFTGYSFISGNGNTIIKGNYVNLLGKNLSSNGKTSQTIIGQNNKETDSLFVVGGGTSEEDRKNLFEVGDTESKFNTKLKVSEAPTGNNDVLRWGDLTTSQDNSGGTYLTEIKFDGKTLKYQKGSSTVQVTDNQTGSIVTNVTGNNGHTITLSRSNLSGGESAQDGYYISQVNPNGLNLQVKKEKIPDVSVTWEASGTKLINISSDGHGITYKNNPKLEVGSLGRPIWISKGSFEWCNFSISFYDTNNKEIEGYQAIRIYL